MTFEVHPKPRRGEPGFETGVREHSKLVNQLCDLFCEQLKEQVSRHDLDKLDSDSAPHTTQRHHALSSDDNEIDDLTFIDVLEILFDIVATSCAYGDSYYPHMQDPSWWEDVFCRSATMLAKATDSPVFWEVLNVPKTVGGTTPADTSSEVKTT